MFDSPSLIAYPFVLRLGFLFVLVFITVKYTSRGIQNGILLGLITGMSANPIVLFRGSELLPGLPNIISLDRIVWPIVLAIFLFKRSRGQTERLRLDWIERGLLAFIAVMLISMVSHGSYTDPDGEWGLFRIMRGYAFPFVAYFIVRRATRTANEFRAFLVGLGFIAVYFVLTGIAERFGLNGLIFPQFIVNPTYGVHFGRPRGIFLNASVYGLAIATAIPLLVWLYFNDWSPRRYLWAATAVLSAVPLIYTLQRAAWLGAFVAVGVTVLAWPRRRAILTGGLLFAVLCGFWFGSEALMQRLEEKLEKTETIDYRLVHIERGLAMFQENPLFGVGINRYGEEAEQYSFFQTELTEHAHNTWVTILAELGLAGFLSYLIPFGFVLFKSVKDYCRFPERRAILGIIVGLTLAFVAMSISIELRGALYSNALLFTLWAMTLGKTQKQAVAYGRVPRSNLTPIKARMFEGRFSEVARPHVRWP